ncbi:solute carrier family 22 member 21 [Plakobranchus ocellatus]|uniref:Solute carrier family 22 member 21 n=1 Tax=Plakobranchus ocellatus TaxID=259542 RepID=A0AAV4B309_9GAST|nr:solute carrier family 22 member 21 [Plakobranchus ocellatus]
MGIVVFISFICVALYVSASEHTRDVWISRLSHVSSLFVASSWGASILWVTESYPTVTRSLGYAFANFGSRIGAVLAPFLLNLIETDALPDSHIATHDCLHATIEYMISYSLKNDKSRALSFH